MLFCHRRKKIVVFSLLIISIFWLYPHVAFGTPSAWIANHFMAKKIEQMPDHTPAITKYPIISALSGPGPYKFDSCTQIITSRGNHKIVIQLVQDGTDKIQQIHKYTVNAGYDGYIDDHICNWVCTSYKSSWYRIEVLADNSAGNFELIGVFYFYVQVKH